MSPGYFAGCTQGWEAVYNCAVDPLQSLWEAGRRAWPDIDLPAQIFIERVGTHMPGAPLDPGDLYLAVACTLGIDGAVEAFERHVISRVPVFVAHMKQPPAFAEEVQQILRERLLVARPEAPPRIAQYTGRGALNSWVCAVTVRIALDLLTRQGGPQALQEEDGVLAAVANTADPETEVIRRRYAAEFNAALREAFTSLGTEDRNLIHLYHVGQLTTTQLGALLRVNHSTVVRRLAGARGAVLSKIKQLLGERLGIDSAEFRSLLPLVYSRLDLSLPGVLREQG